MSIAKKILKIIVIACLIASVLTHVSSCRKKDSFLPDLALNNDTVIIPKDSITSKVIVFSNTDWQVEIDTPAEASWLSLSKNEYLTKSNGSGRSYFYFTAQENLSQTIRYATLSLTTNKSKRLLVIRQNGQ